MKVYRIIGLMSGTSLDGLDIAYCEFTQQDGWQYRILHAETVAYTADTRRKLEDIYAASGVAMAEMDHEYGRFLGNEVTRFIRRYNIQPDLIASHGHTIYHRPDKGFTLQIGSGADIHALTGLPVVSDFRSVDVAYGGQGAPLVPAGDKLLFGKYPVCLNLGGIANVSFDFQGKRIAYDVCPVNFVLNYLTQQIGSPYDEDGKFAAQGKVVPSLLKELNDLPYYPKMYPKSLGREWIEWEVLPIINKYTDNVPDKLATFCSHIAEVLTADLRKYVLDGQQRGTQVLVTGGGAFNTFLIESFKKKSDGAIKYVIPDKEIVAFKEALIFAFLGLLRVRNENNCLSAVTGASKDNCGGAIYGTLEKW